MVTVAGESFPPTRTCMELPSRASETGTNARPIAPFWIGEKRLLVTQGAGCPFITTAAPSVGKPAPFKIKPTNFSRGWFFAA